MKSQCRKVHLFQAVPPFIGTNARLREPQQQGYEAIHDHFRESTDPALVQIPVGCGKTGLISILPFGIARGRVLIVAPNLTIREALFQAVDSGSKTCFWRNMGVARLTPSGPFAAKLDGADANLADCHDSHFVVTNVQQIAQANNRWLKQMPPDFFDMILLDEGHHNAAVSWQRLMKHFPNAKIVSLTATPFRSDKLKVVGEAVYRYTFLRSMCRGYIKTLRAVHVAPGELSFTFADTEQCATLEEVLKLREEVWFSRGVALADECNRHIVAASIEECENLRATSTHRHQIIAAACSVEHATAVTRLYREAGFHAEAIHSLQNKSRQRHVMGQLRTGKLDAIVQVQMLGEGFDHPPLSVAAVFRPFRTLSPYIQFVGRVMRVVRQNAPGDAANQGIVVSHVGLNTERHWKQFRELDEGDQELWAGLARGTEARDTAQSAANDKTADDTKIFRPEMLVNWELIAELQASGYGQIAPDRAEQTSFGFTNGHEARQKTIVGPQQRRREAKSQLKSRVDDAIRQTLFRAGLSPIGWQIGRKFRFLRRQNNWSAIRYWLYWELNKSLKRRPGSGRKWSLEEVEQAVDLLPVLVTDIERKVNQGLPRRDRCRRYAEY